LKKSDIIDIKIKLAEKLLKLKIQEHSNSKINEICDELLANYICYYLFSKGNKKVDCIDFIAKKGNLEKKLSKWVKNNSSVIDLLHNFKIESLINEPYKLAKTYEKMKYIVVTEDSNKIQHKESLDYRKSCGMFFTPNEIVRFIVENSINIQKEKVFGLVNNGKINEAINLFLELKIADISCGTGSFLTEMIGVIKNFRVEILNQIVDKDLTNIDNLTLLKDEEKFSTHLITEMIYGADIDKNCALICSYNILRTAFVDKHKDLHLYGKSIIVGDSLTGHTHISKKNKDENKSYKNAINWAKQFQSVFSRDTPGFDVIVMNPPYGKVRLESNKGHNKNNHIDEKDRNIMRNLVKLFRDSGEYSLAAYGVLNYYKLMMERAFHLLREKGSFGVIVPNTLLCDKSTSELRKYLFDRMETDKIVEIPENSRFFEDITQSFCIVISSNSGISSKIEYLGDVKNNFKLEQGRFIHMDVDFIRQKFPDMYYIPITDTKGFKIFNKIHENGKLSDYYFIKNSRGEVDLTKFSNILTDKENKKLTRLIRGNDIQAYQISAASNKKLSYIDMFPFIEKMKNSTKLKDIQFKRLICKQIANQTKKKRLEFAIVPPNSILANSCNYILLDKKNDDLLYYLLGYLNSSLVEWRFRITSTNNHINNYEIDDFPLIIPNKDDDNYSFLINIANIAKEIEKSTDIKKEAYWNAKIDGIVFNMFNLSNEEVDYLLTVLNKSDNYKEIVIKNLSRTPTDFGIINHVTGPIGENEMKMILTIPPGGNWKNIPENVADKRVKRIRQTGGRTTYYGRLKWDKPSYTINTFFSRSGNGCFIHPEQHRLISIREAARLQSFPDKFIFHGTKTSMYHQIGNAVPPILAWALGKNIKHNKFVDLFCGVGGFSLGLELNGGKCEFALDHDKHCINTFSKNHKIADEFILCEDIKSINLNDTYSTLNDIDLVIGGPPCQGFSTAGKYILDDPRNELVKYFINSIDIIQPKYFVMENVKGLTFFKKGQVVNEIYDEFIKIGYNIQHKVLLAADYGVPQLRERVFFIGSKEKKPIFFPKPIFSKTGDKGPIYTTVKEAINDLPPLEPGGGTMDMIPYQNEHLTTYQALMRGIISIEDFISEKLEKDNVSYMKPKNEACLTLDMFH
jgi:DNA-cytosine methyltransferase